MNLHNLRHLLAGAPALAALPALLLLACGPAAGPPNVDPTVTSDAEGFELRLWLDPDPPKQNTELRVELRAKDGSSVKDAVVEVGWLMPAMGAMAEMKGQAEVARLGSGLYLAPLDLPMSGTWTLTVEARTQSSTVLAEYSLNVGTAGLRQVAVRGVGAQPHVHSHGSGDDDISHYTCSMHPSVKRDGPGTCPICSMDLVPVTRQEVATGVFVVDSARRQEIGVRTEAARLEPVNITVRAIGEVTYDETRLSEVTVKYAGWIDQLHVDRTGERIRRGDVLFELYSPELYTTQEELLAALASQRAARATSAPERADYLVAAARQRLRLWDLSDDQIAAVETSGTPIQYLPILAATSGTVIEKHVVEGAKVDPGQTLYRLAGLDTVWIEAEVYEAELGLLQVGQRAEITLSYLPGRTFEGTVSFIYPYLDARSRTGKVRLQFANPDLELKPEMYANVTFQTEQGQRLTVPDEAVLYAGERRLVFVDLGEGRLEPRPVEVGIRSGDRVEILDGLEAGEVIVSSGNFLIAAESRLKSATGKW